MSDNVIESEWRFCVAERAALFERDGWSREEAKAKARAELRQAFAMFKHTIFAESRCRHPWPARKYTIEIVPLGVNEVGRNEWQATVNDLSTKFVSCNNPFGTLRPIIEIFDQDIKADE